MSDFNSKHTGIQIDAGVSKSLVLLTPISDTEKVATIKDIEDAIGKVLGGSF